MWCGELSGPNDNLHRTLLTICDIDHELHAQSDTEPEKVASETSSGPINAEMTRPVVVHHDACDSEHENVRASSRRRGRKIHPTHVTNSLKKWLADHERNPYPTKDQKVGGC